MNTAIPVGAAAGCDLLMLKINYKLSLPAAAPTEGDLHLIYG
jgi:hypothetical protein